MKKKIVLFIIMVFTFLVVGLTSCKKKEETETPNNSTPSTQEPSNNNNNSNQSGNGSQSGSSSGNQGNTENQEKTDFMFNEIKENDVIVGYEVAGLKDTTLEEVVIPEKYNNLPVTSIGNNAFKDCSSLTSITIPDSVTSIGDSAFFSCSSLDKVYYNGTIEDWCKISFINSVSNPMSTANHFYLKKDNDWEEVTSIEIPNTLTEINYQFYGFNYVTSIKIPDTATSIGNDSFFGCPIEYANIPTIAISSIPKSKLKEVVINSGESIESEAFRDCSSLTNITIPESVINIGERAFYNCPIEYANIPTTVISSIPKSKLQEVVINSGESIEDSTFKDCSSLTNITISSSVISIGNDAFYGCPIEYANIPTTVISSIPKNKLQEVVINSGESIESEAFRDCSSLTNITISSSVTNIGNYAFYNCPIKYANIPTTVISSIPESKLQEVVINSGESIGQFAFRYCSSLTSVTIGDSVTSIGSMAFRECTGLKNITIPNSVTSIGESAFLNCSNLTNIIIPSSVTSIGHNAFAYCYIVYANIPAIAISEFSPSSLKEVVINSGESIESEAFKNCSNLRSITIPKSLTSIGYNAFSGCTRLNKVYYDGTIGDWFNIGFKSKDDNPMIYANHLYLKKDNNWEEVTSIEIPNTITEINYQFYGFNYVTSITIPDSVTSIGDLTFENCYSLDKVYYNGTIEDWCKINFRDSNSNPMRYANHFYLKKDNDWEEVTSIEIPNTITKIGNFQFYGFNNVTSIIIPNSVTNIGYYSAFSDCSSLTNITIGNSVTSIGDLTFENCYRLDKVYYNGSIEDWCNINFADGIFSSRNSNHFYLKKDNDWEEVTSIEIPNTITKIGDYQFAGFNNVTSITIPDKVKSIGENAFFSCRCLTNVTIPNSVTSIGWGAFSSCSNLTNITIGNSVKSIENYAFSSCVKLVEIYNYSQLSIGSIDYGRIAEHAKVIHKKEEPSIIKTTEDGLFDYMILNDKYCLLSYKGQESNVTLPNDLEGHTYEIYNYTFYENENLKEITIPNSVTGIGDYAFYECGNLTSITIPNSVTNIGDSAFSNCFKLVEIYNYSSLKFSIGLDDYGEIAKYAKIIHTKEELSVITEDGLYVYSIVDGKYYLVLYKGQESNVTLPNDLEGHTYEIYNYTFYENENLKEITVPNSVTGIGDYAFYECRCLTRVTIGNSVTSIGDYAFSDCSSLTNITIPNSVTSIGRYAFSDCSSLTNVTIPNSVTSIGDYAFRNCSGLDKVYYNGTVKDWCKINFVSSYSNPMFYASCFFLKKDSDWEEITSIEIPNTITRIGNYQFYGFNNVNSITIPESVTSIGHDAFAYCYIVYANIPAMAISYISGLLKEVVINSGESIGKNAFSSSVSLTCITIADSVKKIESGAFYNCSKLDKVYYNGTEDKWNSIVINNGNSYLTSATRYYYSYVEPNDSGHYWHYDSNGNVVEW